jgi:hypothetical protein
VFRGSGIADLSMQNTGFPARGNYSWIARVLCVGPVDQPSGVD